VDAHGRAEPVWGRTCLVFCQVDGHRLVALGDSVVYAEVLEGLVAANSRSVTPDQ
jgi:hypothetical protein